MSFNVDFADRLGDDVEASLTVYPSPLSSMLDGLQGMLRMPHGCFEQTSSSNYPNVLVLRHLDHAQAPSRLGIDRAAALKQGYGRLSGFQVASGGFETFGRGPGKEALSAYGLLQFEDMRAVWPEVSNTLVRENVDFLMSRRDGQGGFQSTGRSAHAYGAAPAPLTDAYITWALVETGHGEGLAAEVADVAELGYASQDPYLLALATLTLQHRDARIGAALAQRLAQQQGQDGSFSEAETSIVRSGGEALTVETTALATLALQRSQAHQGSVLHAVRWLVEARQGGGGWGTTQATVLALKALAEVSASAPKRQDGGTVEVWVDGRSAGRLSYQADSQEAVRLDLSDVMTSEEHQVTLVHDGATRLPYTFGTQWHRAVPPSAPHAPLRLTTRLAQPQATLGHVVPLRVEVHNTRDDQDIASPLARIGLPAGVRVEPKQLQDLRERGMVDFFETRPREITLYWEALGPGQRIEISLSLVTEIPGAFTAPPSTAYPYYEPTAAVWAEGPALRILPSP